MASKSSYEIDFERVVELISKYEQIKKSGEIKKYNEESTKKDFILPLFEALGWNVYNRGKRNDSISAEETISKKRVDYGFRINGIPKFFLEAKSLKEENIQTNPKYITQAIDYAWMKSCSWAILCNFETIAVFNADWNGSNFGNNLLFVLHPSDFLSDKRFEHLSKNAFVNKELDKVASQYGKKQTKNPINKQLLQDMIHFREILSKDIIGNNQDKHLSQDDLDESVQRILDRLIFIRNAEDRELEENRLQSNLRQWASKGKGQLVREISKVYSYFDQQYNSKLFAKHLCDDLYLDNEVLIEVIEGLNHSKDNSYRYDFSIIESDVLGNIYEQYLGNILKATPKRAKLSESKTHRKEQGIYYTPSYIVDYIVKNTVGEYIKTHTPEEIKNVKILDPACGSGSFLIRAYKELESYWEDKYRTENGIQETLKFDEVEVFYSRKVEILKNNIFGVDLDPKAVEIAQLNLLLQISERKQRLPLLQGNIKIGNSLIDDSTVSNGAFKWEEEFPEIMKNGGFDIVIGNPPYGAFLGRNEIQYLRSNKKNMNIFGKINTYRLFVEKAEQLLKEQGNLGYIIPNTWLSDRDSFPLRKLLLTRFKEAKVIHIPESGRVFIDVTQAVTISIFKRFKSTNDFMLSFMNAKSLEDLESDGFLSIYGSELKKSSQLKIPLDITHIDLLKKIKMSGNESFLKFFDIRQGEVNLTVYKDSLSKVSENSTHPLIRGDNIERYHIVESTREKERFVHFKNIKRDDSIVERIGLKEVSNMAQPRRLKATIIREGYNLGHTADYLIPKGNTDRQTVYYALALLNSKLLNFYFKSYSNTNHISVEELSNLPVKYNNVAELAKKSELLCGLYDTIDFATHNDKMFHKLKEINSLESVIDGMVYELYGLDSIEVKTVDSF